MEQYGTAQTILTNTSDVEKKMKDGFKITACTAQGSVFYIIMTKGTKDYKGKQEWFTSDSWDEAKSLIQEKYKERRVVTEMEAMSLIHVHMILRWSLERNKTCSREIFKRMQPDRI